VRINASDYSIYNRMEDVAKQAVAIVLEEHPEGCSCGMCRDDMQSFLLNQLRPRYVPVLPGAAPEALTIEDLDADETTKVVWEAHRAMMLVRNNSRHEHDRAPMQNCTERMVCKALGEVLTQEKLEISREQLSQVMASVLNELPARYTTSFKGDAFARTAELDWGSLAKVYSTIYNALKELELIPAHS